MALPALAIPAAIAGGTMLAGYLGGEQANKTNIAIADKTNAANQLAAQQQMNWQEKMSNTAHQRAREDLRKAGLNPLLAAGSPASSPGGAAASNTPARVENVLGPAVQSGVASAMEAVRMGQEIKMQAEQSNLVRAQTNQANMQTTVMSKDIPKAEIINDVYKAGKAILDRVKAAPQANPRMDSYMEDFNRRHKNQNLNNYKKGMKTIQLKAGKP